MSGSFWRCVVPPDRDDQRGAGDGVGDHPAVEAEDLADDVLGDDLGGRSLGDAPRRRHRDEVVGVPRGQVEVVQHHHDGGAAAGVEVGEQVEHLDLVGEVEVRRGLVEQQQVGALGEGHRDPDPLPLAAGQLVDDPVGQVGGVGQRQRLGHGVLVGGAPAPEGALVGVPAAADQVDHGDALGGDRDCGSSPRVRATCLVGQRWMASPSSSTAPDVGLEQPGHPAQQRRLAAGVGADDHRHRGVGDRERQRRRRRCGRRTRGVTAAARPGRPAGVAPGGDGSGGHAASFRCGRSRAARAGTAPRARR